GRRHREVLAGFPPHVRASFELRLQGVGYASIARIVGRPVGTVASAVHRVRKKLLALIKDNGPPSRPAERTMSNTPKPNSVEAPDLKAILAQLGELKADLAATKARLAEVEARVLVEPGEAEEACFVPDTPTGLAGDLLDRLRLLLTDPAQHQSDA